MTDAPRPRILIEHGKHGESYYMATTLEELDAAALEILRIRLGYYIVDPGQPSADDIALAEMTDEDIEKLPGGYQVKADMERKRSSAKSNVRWYKEARRDFELAERLAAMSSSITEGRNGRQVSRAWLLLQDRSDAEYERVELEYPTVAKVVEPA